jgi:hypothetical protein
MKRLTFEKQEFIFLVDWKMSGCFSVLRNMRNDPKHQFKFSAPKPAADKNGKKDEKGLAHGNESNGVAKEPVVSGKTSSRFGEFRRDSRTLELVFLAAEDNVKSHDAQGDIIPKPEHNSPSKKRAVEDTGAFSLFADFLCSLAMMNQIFPSL